MDQYLIETTHREQDCANIVQLLNAQGYLTHFDWGCRSGVHTGWAVIAADSEAEARQVVPPLVRGQTRVVQVCKCDTAALAQMHKKESAFPNLVMLRMFKAFPCWW
jgi:hypothetical protein